jgi:hypothetical protein
MYQKKKIAPKIAAKVATGLISPTGVLISATEVLISATGVQLGR